jgi:hypothetical protein
VKRPDGPVESYPWPTQLEAHIVKPGPVPLLNGYDVEADLAVHYDFIDSLLVALTGELPSDSARAACNVALVFLAPLSVAHGPTHAAVLAKICGARFSSISSISAIAMAERARELISDSSLLLEWLNDADPGALAPPSTRAADDTERASVTRLRAALRERSVKIAALDERHDLGRMPALLATLHFAGLTHPEQLQAALVVASFASVIAEARSRTVASFRQYPMQVPPFLYEEDDDRSD